MTTREVAGKTTAAKRAAASVVRKTVIGTPATEKRREVRRLSAVKMSRRYPEALMTLK
jgi:hypothetical protein